jgi:hypothetical protein
MRPASGSGEADGHGNDKRTNLKPKVETEVAVGLPGVIYQLCRTCSHIRFNIKGIPQKHL